MHILEFSTANAILRDVDATSVSEPPTLPIMMMMMGEEEDDDIPPSLPSTPLRKKVQFANPNDNQVHYNDFTSTASVTWYNRTEYAKFKSDVKDTIVTLYRKKGDLCTLDPNQHTLIGLERSLTYSQITSRKKMYAMYVQMILHLHQQEYCRNDPILLRDISMIYTHSAAQRAHIRGCMVMMDVT
jgi:hypothetical protein